MEAVVVEMEGGGDDVDAFAASGSSLGCSRGGCGGAGGGGRLPPSRLRSAKNCARMSADG